MSGRERAGGWIAAGGVLVLLAVAVVTHDHATARILAPLATLAIGYAFGELVLGRRRPSERDRRGRRRR